MWRTGRKAVRLGFSSAPDVTSGVASEEGAQETSEKLVTALVSLAAPSAHPSVSEDDVRAGAAYHAVFQALDSTLERLERTYS